MHPLRVAVIVFVVGASVANFLAAKAYSDRIWLTIPGKVNPDDPFGPSTGPGTPSRVAKMEFVENNDRVWMREAIICTIAGVAWLVVRPKVAQ